MIEKPESLRERAAQLLMPRLGSNMPPAVAVADDVERAARLLESVPVGGFVIFRGTYDATPAALARLQDLSPTPLLFASDLERGAGQQLAGATVFPHAMAFGHADGPAGAVGQDYASQAARVTAEEAGSAGVRWLFAPVADVHSNPVNPIISTRAFSTHPAECARLVTEFIEGCRAGGGLSTAKHFPGHGETDTDSHDALPTVSKTRAQLDEVELIPFRAAIEAGVDAIMTAHVAYPSLDPSGAPATFSAPILRGLLRDELGFRGVVVSDSLLMGAAGEEVSARAPELIAAGVDVLLDVSHPEVALASILSAVRGGHLSEWLVQEAFERVWSMKTKAAALRDASRPDGPELSQAVASKAIEVTGNLRAVLSGSQQIPLIVIRPHTDYPDPTRADTASILAEASDRFVLCEVGPDTTKTEIMTILERVAAAGTAVLALVVKPAAWHAFGLLPWQHAFSESVLRTVPTVLCVLGSPDADRTLSAPAVRIASFSDVESSVRAVSRVLKDADGA
ncbi:MAG: beta-N-acetylhexosaminidase [Rhodothermales bacterium]|jgi:beta-N-acetylhexosaminidase